MRERSVKVENSVTERVQGVLRNILCSWGFIVLLYHCSGFALHVSRRINSRVAFLMTKHCAICECWEHTMNIHYGLDTCLTLLSVEGQKCNLALALLQLLCTAKWLSPFVKVLSIWLNKCPLLTACVRSPSRVTFWVALEVQRWLLQLGGAGALETPRQQGRIQRGQHLQAGFELKLWFYLVVLLPKSQSFSPFCKGLFVWTFHQRIWQ